MNAMRTELHTLLDQLPDDVLPQAVEALASLAANETSLSSEEEDGIRRGLRDAAEGRMTPGTEVFAALREKYSAG